jgi:Fcf1
LEKLGGKYKIALRLAKDPRFERIPCNCKGCYADDCLIQMATQWRCFIVATCDKELRGRVRKIPGVPAMYISGYRYTVERMPEVCNLCGVWSSIVHNCRTHLSEIHLSKNCRLLEPRDEPIFWVDCCYDYVSPEQL